MLEDKSYGKINWCLSLQSKSKDGYHQLHSIMSKISLYDRIRVGKGPLGIHLKTVGQDIPLKDNLVYKAASLFYETLREEPKITIELDKHIPAGAGLGGGSSNCAKTLEMLNEYHGNPFSQEVLLNLGAKMGSDVPFFLGDSPAFVWGRGEHLEIIGKTDPVELLLALPGIHISTKEVYEAMRPEEFSKVPKGILVESFVNKEYNLLVNDLEKGAFRIEPSVKRIKVTMEKYADFALMSGSGSTVFGVFQREKMRETAEKALLELGCHVTKVWTLSEER